MSKIGYVIGYLQRKKYILRRVGKSSANDTFSWVARKLYFDWLKLRYNTRNINDLNPLLF